MAGWMNTDIYSINRYIETSRSLYFVSPTQMRVSMDEFRSLAARYADLYQSSFDADSATLRNVELYP